MLHCVMLGASERGPENAEPDNQLLVSEAAVVSEGNLLHWPESSHNDEARREADEHEVHKSFHDENQGPRRLDAL